MKNFGFVGLGIMGAPMARNLVRAGFDVTVWNRSSEKCAELEKAGAHVAKSPREVAERVDITFAMLADPHAAEQVALGHGGVLEGIRKGCGYVDMSTVDPGTSKRISEKLISAGARYLEAPVSGSKKPAEDGTLVILSAGDRTLHDEALPCFEKMGKKIVYLGETGNGAKMKLVVNMIMGTMITAFSEGLALAAKSGLSSQDLLEVLDAGAMSNPMFRMKGELMTKGEFSPAFPLKHMQKDLRLALQLGDDMKQPLMASAAANEVFKRAKEMGLSDDDFSAVVKAVWTTENASVPAEAALVD